MQITDTDAAGGASPVTTNNKAWGWSALPLLAITVTVALAPWLWPDGRPYVFPLVLAMMAGELMLIGWLVNGRLVGSFIDSRNRISLSKLQAAAWTVVVLSALITAAAYNIGFELYRGTTVSALAIEIPGELLLAMGISATSLVAAPALLSAKAQPGALSDYDKKALEDKASETLTEQAPGDATVTVTGRGKVLTKASTDEASWADLFTGEELGNAGAPDLGKIQQVFVTLMLLGTYIAYVIADLASGTEVIATLPLLDKSFVWLLGLSHASYLAYKAAPHTAAQ